MNKSKTTSKKTQHLTRKPRMTRTQASNDEQVARTVLEKLAAVVLIIVALCCLYLFLQIPNYALSILQSPFYGAISSPPIPALLVGIFCCLTAYMLFKKKPINKFIGWTSCILVVAFGWLTASNSLPKCIELSGATQSCPETGYFQLSLLLTNPFSLLLWSGLAIAGIVVLVVQLRK